VPALEPDGIGDNYYWLTGLLMALSPDRLNAFLSELSTMTTRTKPADDLESVIKARIHALGLTPAELARRSGVSTSIVQRFVLGERSITLSVAKRLAETLDLVLVPTLAASEKESPTRPTVKEFLDHIATEIMDALPTFNLADQVKVAFSLSVIDKETVKRIPPRAWATAEKAGVIKDVQLTREHQYTLPSTLQPPAPKGKAYGRK
jgi:transcriptional regulator with XRE-family HTH domain